jgi:hypothetical protein
MRSIVFLIGIFYIFIGTGIRAEEYRQLFAFNEGLAVAQTTGGEWIVIDEQGATVLSLSKLNVESFWGRGFNEELMVVVASNRKFGFIDIAGKMAILPNYDNAEPFSEGLAVVSVHQTGYSMKSKYGYINKKGEFVVDLQYDNATSFHEGRAFVLQESSWFLINQSGKFISSQAFETVRDFSEGLAPVRVNSLWGYIDREGTWRIPPSLNDAFAFNEGLAGVSRIGSLGWDFIDLEGNIVYERVAEVIPFESNLYFQEGWAVIPKANKYWYLSIDGRKLPAIYDSASYFSDRVAIVWIDGKAGVIDQAGNWPIKIGEFDGLSPFKEGKAIARKGNKLGYINTRGEWLF